MGSLDGKVALVTGGSRGIGRAIAIDLGAAGATVVVNYASNEAAAKETCDAIVARGGANPISMKFDVGDATAVDENFERVKSELGGLHVLVNNAGISRDGLLLRFKDAAWAETINTNLTGAFYCARAAAKIMMKQRWGRIINISSVVGECGNAGQIAYAAAKSGLHGLTKTLAQELASRNITTNAIAPGFISTDMTAALTDQQRATIVERVPLKAIGEPEHVSKLALFLASDDAAYITGQVIGVNGGMYM